MKKSTGTAKPIRFDARTAIRRDQLIRLLESLPGIQRESDPGKLPVRFSVTGHEPLSEFTLSYRVENRFWTRHYNPVLSVSLPSSEEGKWIYRGSSFSGPDSEVKNRLNRNSLLAAQGKRFDFSELTVSGKNSGGCASLMPFGGSIVRILFPGATYLIRPTAREAAAWIQTLQLILAEFSKG